MSAPSRPLVIGTAGHIDHGKTTLVHALTGTNTDRLPEEKRRGITIELGFAAWRISAALEASVVDVPGHEGFVRTMVAGAAGLDMVLFVISAEDGVMPQTREHLRICELLGLRHAVVALTKIDRLEGDEDAIEMALDDVRECLHETVFFDAPIVPVAATTGAGIEDLRGAVAAVARKIPRKSTKGDAILPLDRVFTIKGHGTVVTGTLLTGSLDPDRDLSLRLVPHGTRREAKDLRARALEIRGDKAKRSVAGDRTALNLGGIPVSAISRGDVITDGHRVVSTSTIHVRARLLPHASSPWTSGSSVQLCAGTASTAARMDPLAMEDEAGELGPAETDICVSPGRAALIRLRLDVPIPIWQGQPIVLRAFNDPSAASQGLTIGGGLVVDPLPSGGKRQRRRWLELARGLASNDARTRIRALVGDAGALGVDLRSLQIRAGINDLTGLLAPLVDSRSRPASAKGPELLKLPGDRYVLLERLDPLIRSSISTVDHFHAAHPMRPGMARATLEAALPGRVAPEVAAAAIDAAVARGQLHVADHQGSLARPGKGTLSLDALPPAMQEIYDRYVQGDIAPPTLKDVQDHVGMDAKAVLEIVGLLQRADLLIKVTPELSFAPQAHQKILDKTRERLREAGEIDVQALKTITGLSRKFVVPLLEHLDQLGVTLRRGDRRIPGPRASVTGG